MSRQHRKLRDLYAERAQLHNEIIAKLTQDLVESRKENQALREKAGGEEWKDL